MIGASVTVRANGNGAKTWRRLKITVPPLPAVGGWTWMASGGTTVRTAAPVTPRAGFSARVRLWAARIALAKLNSTSSGLRVSPSPGRLASTPWNFTFGRSTNLATVVMASHGGVAPAQLGFDADGTALSIV